MTVSDLDTSTTKLKDIGLAPHSRNVFEIHEKEGGTRYDESDSISPLKWPGPSEKSASLEYMSSSIKPTFESDTFYPSCANSSIISSENIGYTGLINQAMTCYLNSLVQSLYMTPEFRNGIYRWSLNEVSSDEDNKKNIPFQLQRLFLNLQTSNKKAIHTSDLTKSFGWNSDDAFQQHDVQELCRVMFDALEKKVFD